MREADAVYTGLLRYSLRYYCSFPSDPPYKRAYAPPEFDTKIFDSSDHSVLVKAVELCKVLQGKHYFTDTAGFSVRCNVCGGQFVGEKGLPNMLSSLGITILAKQVERVCPVCVDAADLWRLKYCT
jgi:hypothetical protein